MRAAWANFPVPRRARPSSSSTRRAVAISMRLSSWSAASNAGCTASPTSTCATWSKRVPLPVELSEETPDDEAHRQHDPALLQALAQLDPAYRLPILLHYYADLSLEQVGRSLNLSVPAIKSRLHRARAQLRNSLADAEVTL